MVFKARELKRLQKFLNDIFEVHPVYNQQKYFNVLLDLYYSQYVKNNKKGKLCKKF